MAGPYAELRKSNIGQGWGNLTESGRNDNNYDFSIVDHALSLSTEFPQVVNVFKSLDRIKGLRYNRSGSLNLIDMIEKEQAKQVMVTVGDCRGCLPAMLP